MMNKWNTVSYIGITGKFSIRVWQHKQKVNEGFTKKYNINKLVYYETFDNPSDAIAREKQLKRWSRKKKVELIKKKYPFTFLKIVDDTFGRNIRTGNCQVSQIDPNNRIK